MLTVWRLLSARFARSAFSGEGARLYGGRWNRKGTPMVYTAGSQSLAMLEMLVQDEPLRARYVMLSAALPKNLKIERVTPAQLPADWRDPGARDQLQAIGTDWVNRGSSAAYLASLACTASRTVPGRIFRNAASASRSAAARTGSSRSARSGTSTRRSSGG